MGFEFKDRYTVDDLVEILKILRGPNGCPWDKAQTHESIRRNLIEETYEVVEAIDQQDSSMMKEELGDLLLQVVFHAQLKSEQADFDFDDVCNGICQKLVYRHPHIFSDVSAATPEEALATWEGMKKIEKNQITATNTLEQVSKALPALMYSEKVQKRAAKTGFDYDSAEGAAKDLESELLELKEAVQEKNSEAVFEEFGDLLFSCVNLSRFLAVDAEKALYDSTVKFIGRFAEMERLATERGMVLEETELSVLNSLWTEAKNIHKNFGGK